MAEWEIKRVALQEGVKGDLESLILALEDGWEPYCVTRSGPIEYHHLRRQVPAVRYADLLAGAEARRPKFESKEEPFFNGSPVEE